MNANLGTDHFAPLVSTVKELYELAERKDDAEAKAIALRLYAQIAKVRKGLGLPAYPLELSTPEGRA